MDWLFVVIVAVAGVALIAWAVRTGDPRGPGSSDADRYQQELARRSQVHTQEQVARALALKPVHPAGRTGYSSSEAYRTAGTSGQNAVHGQNLPGSGSGQNAGGSPARPPAGPQQINPQLMMQLQAMARGGQKIGAIKVLRQATGMRLVDAKNFVDRL